MISESLLAMNTLALSLKRSRAQSREYRRLLRDVMEADHYETNCPCSGCKAQNKAKRLLRKKKP